MNFEEDGFCKPDNLKRRLRLKKNEESKDNKTHLSDNFNNERDSIASTSQSFSACDDDSILDFKSPKRLHPMQSKVIKKPSDKVKKKMLHSKPKIINNERKPKSRKPLQTKKIDAQRSLIESSFFKSEKKETESLQKTSDMKTAYVCPLCFKNFKDENSQTVHMKNCAVKHNVSTKKLIDAVELQERQAAERKSLGLLSAPILQDKKKTAPCKIMSSNDSDLQLALALSKSLYEKKEMEEWDEVELVAISSNSSVPDNNKEEHLQKATLQSFGFSSSKNTLPTNNWPINKTKKRKHLEPTILQKRTPAERERILTERIAEILMGYTDFTQKIDENIVEPKEKIVLKNQLLQQLRKIENTLWDRTKLIIIQDIFYVKQLSPQIVPSEKKKQELDEQQDLLKLIEANENKNEKVLDNEQIQEMNEIRIIETTNNDKALTINTCCKEQNYLNNLATSWRNILNDSSASDVIILLKNDRHIWAHKLVFYTRCANILLDITYNDTEYSTAKEKLCWPNTDYDIALAFLEFIYCGTIDKYSKIFYSEACLSDVRVLGRKYKIHDLFIYLRQKEINVTEDKYYNTFEKDTENIDSNIETALHISFKTSSNSTHDVEKTQCSENLLLQENVNPLTNCSISTQKLCILEDEKVDLIRLSEKVDSKNNTPTKWETSVSPDMFEDTPITKHSDKSMGHSIDLEDSNTHVLLSLIKQDADFDICSQKLLKIKNVEHSEFDQLDTTSNNIKQNVTENNSDSESNSVKLFIDNMHKDSLIDTPRSNKSKYIRECSLNLIKQKSNLSLFIQKIQEENAQLNAVLDSNIECLTQMSPIRQKNPFYVEYENSDNNIKQSIDMNKRPGRLTIIEQHMQSFAAKNPEFYSHSSDEHIKNIEQTNLRTDSPSSKKVESLCDNMSNCIQNLTSSKEDDSSHVTSVQITGLQHSKAMNQSFNETFFDSEPNEEEMSIYSKYMKDHKDNSIAKYRPAITTSKSESDLSDKSINLINDNSSDSETNEILTQHILTQKDANNINSSTESNRDKLISTQTFMTQALEVDDKRKKLVPSPIMISSSSNSSNDGSCSPVLNMEDLFQNECCTENKSKTNTCKLNKFSFNFDDDIYLANVDTDKYEKLHVLEKSQSFNILSTAESKNGNARKYKNKDNYNNIESKNTSIDNYENLDNNTKFLTQTSTSIRKFKRKSLSEGQINTKKSYTEASAHTSTIQFQCNYIQNTGYLKTPKIIDKDVTPPPDYNEMNTPELHREMKKYGLKAQKRSKAVKLLTHIYNELHPLVPETMTKQQVTEISSDEDEGPPSKKRNMDENSLERLSNTEASDNENQDSNDSASSLKETVNDEMQFYETSSLLLENSSDIVEAFTRLLNNDKDLYSKILQYEPINIEQLRSMLQIHGFKCKLANLMSFLDQQCITFYAPEQSVKSKMRRKT